MSNKNSKKQIAIIGAIALIILVAIGFFMFSDFLKKYTYDETTSDANITIVTEDIIVEESTYSLLSGIELGADMELLIKSNFILNGTMHSETEDDIIFSIAYGDGVFDWLVSADNMTFGFCCFDDATYFYSPELKLCANITYEESFFGMNFSDFTFSDVIDFENLISYNSSFVTEDEQTYNCIEMEYEYGTTKYFVNGDELEKIETCDNHGVITNTFVVEDIVSQIPDDRLTLDGYVQADAKYIVQSLFG